MTAMGRGPPLLWQDSQKLCRDANGSAVACTREREGEGRWQGSERGRELRGTCDYLAVLPEDQVLARWLFAEGNDVHVFSGGCQLVSLSLGLPENIQATAEHLCR